MNLKLAKNNTKLKEERDALIQKMADAPTVEDIESIEYHVQGMGCGLEDRDIIDRYDAMAYGWECAIGRVLELFPPEDIEDE